MGAFSTRRIGQASSVARFLLSDKRIDLKVEPVRRRSSRLARNSSSRAQFGCVRHWPAPIWIIAPGDDEKLRPLVRQRAAILQYNRAGLLDICRTITQVEDLDQAIGPKTRAIVLAHALGNPFDLHAVMDCARRHNLLVIEDNCDALGATYSGSQTGSFGLLATQSFYPPHHLTMGEGGAILTDSGRLRRIAASFRDWGRDCWCPAGKDNSCGRRFQQQAGDLPGLRPSTFIGTWDTI